MQKVLKWEGMLIKNNSEINCILKFFEFILVNFNSKSVHT